VDAHQIQLSRVAGVSLERLLNFIKTFVGWHHCDKSPVVKPDIPVREKVKPTRPKTSKTRKETMPLTKQKTLPFPKACVAPSTMKLYNLAVPAQKHAFKGGHIKHKVFAQPVKQVEPESEEEPSMFNNLGDEPQQAIVNFIGEDLMNLTVTLDQGIRVY
jgi:hypothetical protein